MNSGASPHHRIKPGKSGKSGSGGGHGPPAGRPVDLTCPMCGCPVHAQPRTWEVVCASCGEKRWPFAVVAPPAYVCARCRGTSPEKRAAARAAGKKSAESRRKAALR